MFKPSAAAFVPGGGAPAKSKKTDDVRMIDVRASKDYSQSGQTARSRGMVPVTINDSGGGGGGGRGGGANAKDAKFAPQRKRTGVKNTGKRTQFRVSVAYPGATLDCGAVVEMVRRRRR